MKLNNRQDFMIKGVMLDSARILERRDTYRRLISLFSQWGYNTLFWHFCDDEGCSIKMPSMPQIARKHAYSPAEMRELIEFAANKGIAIIPELECLGHTSFITGRKEFAHLRDGMSEKPFASICPLHPETKAIISALIKDTASIFGSEYIHVGMDEVSFGSNIFSQNLLKKKKKYEIYAKHLKWVHSEVKKNGRKMMIWGDHLIPPDYTGNHLDLDAINPKIADIIDKDIVICDWHYKKNPSPSSVDFFIKKGFNVLACPATSAYGIIGHPAEWNCTNLEKFIDIAAKRTEANMLGIINTVWTPQRWLTGTSLYGMALGAELQINHGRKSNEYNNKFLSTSFGLKETPELIGAFVSLHEISPPRFLLFPKLCPLSYDDIAGLTAEETGSFSIMAIEAKKAYNILRLSRKKVRKNINFYDQITFTAKAFKVICESYSAMTSSYEILINTTENTLNNVSRNKAEKQAKVIKKLYEEGKLFWTMTRFQDDPELKTGKINSQSFISIIGSHQVFLEFLSQS